MRNRVLAGETLKPGNLKNPHANIPRICQVCRACKRSLALAVQRKVGAVDERFFFLPFGEVLVIGEMPIFLQI